MTHMIELDLQKWGGRGASSGAGGGRSGGGMPKLQTMSGSEKQVKWASDIRDGAFSQLDRMDRHFDEALAKEREFIRSTGGRYSAMESTENLLGYSKKDVQETRQVVANFLNSPQAQSASFVIDRRTTLTSDYMIKTVQAAAEQRKRRKK